LENRRAEQVLPRGSADTSMRGQVLRKRIEERISCKKCVHLYVNAKTIPVETTSGIRGGRKKENS
jgi:hypothetical protein